MLTTKESIVLEAIVNYIEINGFSPSIREMCELVGLKSTSTVHNHLTNLENKGYIERKGNLPRALRVVKK